MSLTHRLQFRLAQLLGAIARLAITGQIALARSYGPAMDEDLRRAIARK